MPKNFKQKILTATFLIMITLFFVPNVSHAIEVTPPTDDEIMKIISEPQLQIRIPGLNFTTQDDKTNYLSGDETKKYVVTPFLGEYIAAVYRYLVVATAIIAVVIIIIQGFMWTISGGESEKINNAKKKIGQAIVGLIIAFSSYSLLYAINPELVTFRNLNIVYITTDSNITPWTKENIVSIGDVVSGKKYCGCIKFRDIYDTTTLKDANSISARINKIRPDSPLKEYGALILEMSQKYKIDPMLAIAIWQVDSNLGTAGLGKKNKNPGNIICGGSPNGTPGKTYTCDDSKLHFRVYKNWEDAIRDWFNETDITTGPKMWRESKTIKEIISRYCPDETAPKYIDWVTGLLYSTHTDLPNDLNNGSCSC